MTNALLKTNQGKRYIKLLLALFVSLVIFTLFYLLLLLPSLRNDIYNEKKLQTTEMVAVAYSVLDHYYKLEEKGVLSRSVAQSEAGELIRTVYYGDEGLDYFWINDYHPKVIIHPFRPDLEGLDVTDYQDAEGLYLFREIVNLAREQGSGHLSYHWHYYEDFGRFEEKLSYIAAFEPWEWIIGTGVYLVDLDLIIAQRRNTALSLMVVFFLTTVGLFRYYYKSRIIEQQLLESREKYRLIAENTADTVTLMDLDFNNLYVSPSVYKVYGYTPEEAVSRTLEQSLTPESLQKALNAFQREMALLAEGKINADKTLQLELEMYRKDGSTIWVENTTTFMKGDDEEIVGLLSASKDITERKMQQEALQKERLEKNLILDNLTEEVTYMDKEMRIIWANQAVSNRQDKHPSQYIGKKCYQVWHGFSSPCKDCSVEMALKTGKIYQRIIRYRDDQYWRVTGVPVFDSEGNISGVLNTSLEITELVQAEKELRLLNDELEQRVDERTDELKRINRDLAAFTYSVSHDLRAPLRSIEGFSLAALEEYGQCLDQQGKDYLQRVRAASCRMSELIDDLLKLSRVTKQEINRDRANLSAIVEAYSRELAGRDRHRFVEFVVEPDCFAVGDVPLLRIALGNLLENAYKFTASANPARVEFGSFSSNGKTGYYIRDNGIGFDNAYAEKIFNAFQRLQSLGDYPGTGIGLSIVHRIIERHSGSVWADAEPGKGAVFYFTLPA